MKRYLFLLLPALLMVSLVAVPAGAAEKKPNILVIWGDDIGQFNISAYNHGMMATGRRTSTASRKTGRSSRTGTGSRAAPQAGRRSSPGSRPSAPASPRSACPERPRA